MYNDIKPTNITDKEVVNLTIASRNMDLFELNKKLTIA